MTRFIWWGALAVMSVIAGYVQAADSTDVKELLERMKKMETKMAEQDNKMTEQKNKMAEQEKTIADLRAGNTTKATATEQVDKALSSSSAGVIFHDAEIHKRPIKIGGNMDVTYQFAFNQPQTRYNNERVFDNEDTNDFNVHLAKVYFDGTAQEKGQAGFRIDLAMGTDARKMASWDRADSSRDRLLDLEQAYVDYIVPVGNGLRMKVGKFATPVGFEVIESQDNWNATRSLTFGKGIPATHTGIGFEYKVFSNWDVKGYLVNGWDVLQDNNNDKTGVVQSIWSPVKWLTWTVNGVVGNEKAKVIRTIDDNGVLLGNGTRENDDESATRYLVNTTFLFKPWDKWTFGLEGTYGLERNAGQNRGGTWDESDPLTDRPDAEWWSVVGYGKYQFLPAWYLAMRGEYFNDKDGSRTELGNASGTRQELYSGTATLSYTPTNPFEIRLEYRYDASTRRAFAAKDVVDYASDVYGHGPKQFANNQDTITVQFLYKF